MIWHCYSFGNVRHGIHPPGRQSLAGLDPQRGQSIAKTFRTKGSAEKEHACVLLSAAAFEA
jgi:hypothetical protein